MENGGKKSAVLVEVQANGISLRGENILRERLCCEFVQNGVFFSRNGVAPERDSANVVFRALVKDHPRTIRAVSRIVNGICRKAIAEGGAVVVDGPHVARADWSSSRSSTRFGSLTLTRVKLHEGWNL